MRRFAAATVSTSCQVDDDVVADAPTTRRWPHRKPVDELLAFCVCSIISPVMVMAVEVAHIDSWVRKRRK